MTEKEINNLLVNIRNFFLNSDKSIHKARNEIKIIDYKNKELVVKSFKVPHFINRIVYTFFRDSKAKKSYDNSVRIIDYVPKPIGYIEFKKFGLLYDSYYVSENFQYDFTIRELLFDDDFQDKKLILKLFAKFTSDLHENNIYHLDYSPGNILIKKTTDGYIFKIVDVNRMKFIKFDLDTRAKNFSRIWFNDDDLTYVAKEYMKLNDIKDNVFLERTLYYSRKHKQKTELKKRIRKW
ncbi:MAG: lipopolysaccharide kinase InaA family protein [Campylobacterota bacterium]|nr:lipopolysaccharide kinase InaA family protein [Campylobacterota bacterium]